MLDSLNTADNSDYFGLILALRFPRHELSYNLHRRSAGVVWLNPLLETEGYEPTAVGMSAALPYVTTFTSINDQAGLARLSRLVRLRG